MAVSSSEYDLKSLLDVARWEPVQDQLAAQRLAHIYLHYLHPHLYGLLDGIQGILGSLAPGASVGGHEHGRVGRIQQLRAERLNPGLCKQTGADREEREHYGQSPFHLLRY